MTPTANSGTGSSQATTRFCGQSWCLAGSGTRSHPRSSSWLAAAQKIPYSLTGGPAADAIQHFYRSSEVPVFLNAGNHRALRLLPDRTGPVVLLKPFGDLVYWREFEGKMVAPPWLVYAELLNSSDPRAREAAEELRQEFLK